MFYAIMSGSVRKAVILGVVGAVILVAGSPIGAAPSTNSGSQFFGIGGNVRASWC